MTEPITDPAPEGQPPEGAPAPAAPPAGDPPNEPQSQQDEPLGEPGKRALQAERDARKALEKEKSEYAAKLKEFEDRDKSELQRAQEAAQEATRQAQEQVTTAWREALCAAHQISDEDAETFLTGADAETLKRQAQRLVELRGSAEPAAPPTTTHRPTERLRTGVDPTRGDEPSRAEQIAAAEQAGDWAKARTLKSQQLLELGKQTR